MHRTDATGEVPMLSNFVLVATGFECIEQMQHLAIFDTGVTLLVLFRKTVLLGHSF